MPTSCFLPDIGQDPRVDARRNYYVDVLLGALPIGAAAKIERSLLTEHKNFRFAQDFDPVTALVEDVAAYQRMIQAIIDNARVDQKGGSSSDNRSA